MCDQEREALAQKVEELTSENESLTGDIELLRDGIAAKNRELAKARADNAILKESLEEYRNYDCEE